MKQITVKSCGECPFCVPSIFDDGLECANPVNDDKTFIKVYHDSIHKDCPLSDVPTREDARRFLYEQLPRDYDLTTILDGLGFKKEGK